MGTDSSRRIPKTCQTMLVHNVQGCQHTNCVGYIHLYSMGAAAEDICMRDLKLLDELAL